MFDPTKRYYEINREERAFVALLAHLVLADATFAGHVCNAVNQSHSGPPGLNPQDLEVYVEPAPLRDYWRDLGRYRTLNGATHDRRRAVLDRVLDHHGVAPAEIDRHAFFWTGKEHGQGRLWSPGHWTTNGLQETAWDRSRIEEMTTVKKAWNSKPDLMLITGKHAVLIEAKVESGFGAGQLRNARKVAELLHLLCERFTPQPRLLTLTLGGDIKPTPHTDGTIRWRDLLDPQVLGGADTFTREALQRLSSAYPKY